MSPFLLSPGRRVSVFSGDEGHEDESQKTQGYGHDAGVAERKGREGRVLPVEFEHGRGDEYQDDRGRHSHEDGRGYARSVRAFPEEHHDDGGQVRRGGDGEGQTDEKRDVDALEKNTQNDRYRSDNECNDFSGEYLLPLVLDDSGVTVQEVVGYRPTRPL